MPLSPRFRRVAALDRRFVNREGALEAFADELSRVGDRPRVLNVTGVGGIGKSRLLRELRNRAGGSGGCRTAVLDLQVPAMRQQENALAVLRTELGRQDVCFDRFDIAYAVLWQRLHPNLRITSRDLPFLAESEVLTTIVADASGVPVFGTAIGLLKLAERATSWMRRKRAVKADEVLQMLDELGNTEVLDAVTYLFAEELRSAGEQRPFVVFVDAYEALVPTPVRTGRAGAADAWLRDLISQLGRGLVVVASREPLHWQIYDTEWAEVIRDCPVVGLPAGARRELLAEAGILDADTQRAIASASEGLPFYLHLAIDTGTASGDRDTNVVSSEEIVQRFLQHVAPAEVRCLELLSVARIFDYGIFQALTGAFEFPSDRMTWESLTAYSFVYPAGDSEHRLHQLMAAALRARLSPPVVCDVHGLLRELWDRRTFADGTVADVRGFREAVYHGVRAAAMPAEEILDHADQAVRYGGKQAADGMATDLGEYLQDGAHPELATTSQCLVAEAAILMGDAATAATVATSGSWPDLARLADARLAIAAAHARRISGDTSAAGRLYDAVWRHHGGPARHIAGLWVADIHMWQGRFATAFALCREILDSCDPGAQELRGHVLRLMHLGYRFHLDFASATSTLQQARECYQRSGAVVGLANISTNQVELLAWTDPGAALTAAPAALEAQRELGALHELGKTHTAIAIAQMRLGDHSAADASFETACTYLTRARYRSGLARAEFFRGFLHAAQGHHGQAVACLAGAVGEFVAAEVYPTLIVLAAQALDHLGQADPGITRAACAARARIEPLDSITNLDDRAAALIAAMLGATTMVCQDLGWQDLYDTAAAHLDAAAGYYNNNVRVDTPTGPVNVRIPIPGADVMDLRLWREEEILPAIAAHVRYTPPLLHASTEPRYQVHGFIDGPVLNTIAPRGVAVPAHVPADVVALLTELATVPREKLPATPAGWPQDDDTTTFARLLSGLTRQIYATHRDWYGAQFRAFGFPADPLAAAESAWPTLSRRPLVCVHADIHRKNMIIKDGASYFLDWELALWGDPVYDLAVHFHKMGYIPAERDRVLHLWQAALRPECTVGWERDLDLYLAHEQIKSAIVDTVRYSQAFANPGYAPEPDHVLVGKLTVKLNNAHHRWGTTHRADTTLVDATLRSWRTAFSGLSGPNDG